MNVFGGPSRTPQSTQQVVPSQHQGGVGEPTLNPKLAAHNTKTGRALPPWPVKADTQGAVGSAASPWSKGSSAMTCAPHNLVAMTVIQCNVKHSPSNTDRGYGRHLGGAEGGWAPPTLSEGVNHSTDNSHSP